jgi:hypothetical protein
MTEPSSPSDWCTLYAVAMLEGNGLNVPLRVERAEEAIRARSQPSAFESITFDRSLTSVFSPNYT